MKKYLSITHEISRDVDIHAFDKIDGSNIRAEWSRNRGAFYKFGSRKRLIDENDEQLGETVGLIRSKYEGDLDDIFRREGYRKVVCFFEFYGPSSFAGLHRDEGHDIILLDVSPH